MDGQRGYFVIDEEKQPLGYSEEELMQRFREKERLNSNPPTEPRIVDVAQFPRLSKAEGENDHKEPTIDR